jgi:hypothetical protein
VSRQSSIPRNENDERFFEKRRDATLDFLSITTDERTRVKQLLGDEPFADFIKGSLAEIDVLIDQNRQWGLVPATLEEKSKVEKFRNALFELRAAYRDVPDAMKAEWELFGSNLPDLTAYLKRVDATIAGYRAKKSPQDGYGKQQAAIVAREILAMLNRPTTTSVGSEWCRLAAVLYYGDVKLHGQMRTSCLTVLKPSKRPVR